MTKAPLMFLIPVAVFLSAPISYAAPDPTPANKAKAAKSEDGKYMDAEGNPTFNIGPDGRVDWYTFSGYRRFNGACEVCHGFDGSGSTFAPNLTESLKTLSYEEFQKIVVNGKQSVSTAETLVMPAFGTNKNVQCYLDDIYIYLRARAVGGLGPGRPASHEPKPKSAGDYETECMGP